MQTSALQQKQHESTKIKMLSRLDNLQFSKWHFYMIFALGLVWIFDGYEVSLLSLFRKYIVQETSVEVFKSLATAYQVGCIIGSFIFGISSFIIGRKKIFLITLIIYGIGILLSLIGRNVSVFLLARFLTGISVGGQFTAIFTAIDEFLPPKYRGRVNIGVDGTWHLGGSLAAILNMIIGQTPNWRYMFTIGLFGILSLLLMRRNIPQSPRWLLLKNRNKQADLIITSIQYAVQNNRILLQSPNKFLPSEQLPSQPNQSDQLSEVRYQIPATQINPAPETSFCGICWSIVLLIKSTIIQYPTRFLLAVFLMFSQAFFFNLIYYKFPDTLENKFNLQQEQISQYMLPLSISSFVSTLIVGPLFDYIGRKKLLLITYSMSGILLMISQMIEELIWLEVFICFMFFFTSPAGSSANLIASEIFPTSSRTLILFIMFIIGMFGGIGGVWFDTVWFGSILMILAGILGFIFCPSSENKSLEQVQKL